MKSATVSKTSTYYLQIADKEITINAGVLATVTISAPIPYSINSKPTLILQPAQSVTLKLNAKNWEISSGSTEANTIPNLVSGYFLTNNGVRLLWQQIVTGVSSVFGRTGDVTAQNGDYTASQVTNVPAGDIVATNVQDAIDELDTEKIPSTRTINTTSPLSGGGDLSADRTLTTSMNTNRLIGRGTAGVGVMEEIILGTNLTLAGTTLNVATMGEETLAETLVEGNTTGGTDIVVSAGDDIIITDATASRIAGIGSSSEVESLDTATYPSLTELAYVKGVTSAIQTQLDTKALELISTATASASATVDFTGLTTTYSKYIVEFYSVVPATDNTAMYMRIGTGAGPTYQTGATDYAWIWDGGYVGYGTTTFNAFSSADGDDDHIQITGGILTNTANISLWKNCCSLDNP